MAVQEVNYRSLELEQKKARERANAEIQRAHSRRQRLEALQQDNHFEDPHKNLVMAKNVPTFSEETERKQARKSHRKSKLAERWKRTFPQALAEEERFWANNQSTKAVDDEEEEEDAEESAVTPVCNYFTADAGKSRLPPMSFCSICSFPCNMKCVTCEERFCSKKCLDIHKEIRCMKRVM